MAEPRQVVDNVFRAIDNHDAAALAKLYSPGAEFVAPGANLRGPEQISAFILGFAGAFPDLRHTLKNTIVSGSSVVVEGTATGTHNAPLKTPTGEVPATGKRVTFAFAEVIVVEGDKITSNHLYYDQQGFLVQLGLAPAPARA